MAEPTEGRYDTTKTVKENVDADFKRVKDAYDTGGAAAGNDKLLTETQGTALTGASAEQQRQYQEEMARQLKEAKILPELSVAAVLKNPGDIIKGNVVNEQALGRAQYDAKDPLQAATLRAFGDKYQQLKSENDAAAAQAAAMGGGFPVGDMPVSKAQLERTVADSKVNATEKTALEKKQTEDKKALGELVTNPKLFTALADSNGEISKGSIAEFEKKFYALGTAGDDFRKGIGDKAAQDRAAAAVTALKDRFDKPENQDDKKGSIFNENDNWWKLGLGKGDYMTRDSLARGLGYTKGDGSGDVDAMNKKLPTDVAVQTKPIADVPSVTDYSSTAQRRGDGPYQVAQRMLGGDQAKFFKNPAEAQAIMTDVLRQEKIWDKDKQGVPKVTAENREEIVKAIKEREAKVAKDSGKPENNDLSNWFASRYPKIDKTAAAPVDMSSVQPDTDRKTGRIGRGEGPIKIAENMAAGSPLDAAAKQALRQAIKPGEYDDKQGPLTEKSIEAIRKNVLASNNEQLKAWFAKRYPPKA